MSGGALSGGGVNDMGESLSKHHHHGNLDTSSMEGASGGGVAGGGTSTGGSDPPPPPLVCVHVLCGHRSPLTAISYSTGGK